MIGALPAIFLDMITGVLVEKKIIDLKSPGGSRTLFAAAFSKANSVAKRFSLTFEGYISAWTADRAEVERLCRGDGVEPAV